MRKILALWPLFIAFLISWPFNIGWAVIPFFESHGILTGWQLFLITAPLSDLELVYHWWFCNWLGNSIKRWQVVQEGISLGQELRDDFKRDTFIISYLQNRYFKKIWKFIQSHIVKQYYWAINPNNWVIRFLKWGGHLAIFILGVETIIPGTRVTGVFFCRATNWKSGFLTLLVANVFHVAFMVWGWHYFFAWFFSWWKG